MTERQPRKLTRRELIKGSLGAAGLGLLTACTRSETPTPTTDANSPVSTPNLVTPTRTAEQYPTPVATRILYPTATENKPTPTTIRRIETPTAQARRELACSTLQENIEAIPRYPIESAPLNLPFHPIFDTAAFQRSGGTEGQWSWFHTLLLHEAQGLQFRGFERNDAKFVARVNSPDALASFFVLTTAKYKNQFMQGTDAVDGMNIRTLPGTKVEIFDPISNETVGSHEVSQGGDLLVMMPDNGLVGARFPIQDPAASFEAQIWFGPDDRPNSKINRFDARALGNNCK